ncbi:MAG: hypothetical protein KC438_09230 [Thermomicrobiales bacterium]|nr:hypothetical protein [Thermomicrobiales bacterium]
MTAGPGGLSSKHGPALDLPGRFMILAMVMLAAVAVASPVAYPLLLDGFYAPRLLAFVHLNTLGVIAAILLGASYQLIPVVLQTPLASVSLGRISFWFFIAGILFFLPGILVTWRPGLVLGAALAFAGMVLYVAVVVLTLRSAPHLDVVSWHITLALAGLVGGLVVGLLLAVSKGTAALGASIFRILAAHATLMLAAWVVVMLNGVAYRLVGMFTLSEDQLWHRTAWAELFFSAGGAWLLAGGLLADAPRTVLGAGALAILFGQLPFGAQLLHLYHVRRRRGFDIHIPYVLTAIACGLLASLLLVVGFVDGRSMNSSLWVAIGWLAIGGIAISAIQGFFYKIATFLVWLHRYAPVAGRTRVPRLEDLYDRRLAKTGWIFWVGAQAGSLAAIFLSNRSLATAAGIAALAGLGCFLVNVARMAAHVWPAMTTTQDAVHGGVPRIGKEGRIS